jgi:hypothetical protein
MAEPVVLSFEEFWRWIQGHPNCILSAGTPDAVLYDHEDFHWYFDREGQDDLLVQVIRGKSLIGEILIPVGSVSYVQGEPREEEEYVFDCFVEGPEGPVAAYYFALAHEYTPDPEEEPVKEGRWVH